LQILRKGSRPSSRGKKKACLVPKKKKELARGKEKRPLAT